MALLCFGMFGLAVSIFLRLWSLLETPSWNYSRKWKRKSFVTVGKTQRLRASPWPSKPKSWHTRTHRYENHTRDDREEEESKDERNVQKLETKTKNHEELDDRETKRRLLKDKKKEDPWKRNYNYYFYISFLYFYIYYFLIYLFCFFLDINPYFFKLG